MSVTQTNRLGRRVAEIDPAELERLIRRGATQAQAAAAMGVSARTLTKHLAARPELREAVRNGKRVAVRIAGDVLLESDSFSLEHIPSW